LNTQFFVSHLSKVPVIAILRGLSPERTVELAQACWDGGISLIEVPANDAAGLRALEALTSHAESTEQVVGAGTIYTAEGVRHAAEAGARFLVAPGIDRDAIHAAADRDLPYLPGVATPSEVQLALTLGLSVLKAFPASALGTQWFQAMRGPFPDVRLVATGGVNAANARQYLDAGAVALGVGSGLSDAIAVTALVAACTAALEAREEREPNIGPTPEKDDT
jgi:2-dehydro-3-deoxyphosphogluconate aldolase/(4S)-4-hydroxy-2-oxoglutarate aldolase